MFDKLGDNFIMKVYFVEADYHTMTEITDPREHGKFFAESCYVIQLKSASHQYFINWIGPNTGSDNLSKI